MMEYINYNRKRKFHYLIDFYYGVFFQPKSLKFARKAPKCVIFEQTIFVFSQILSRGQF